MADDPGVPSIRSRMPALAGVFAATVLVALASSLGIAAATHSLSSSVVRIWIFISVGVGCIANSISIHFLFQRPLVEAWALGGVKPERRQTVRVLQWTIGFIGILFLLSGISFLGLERVWPYIVFYLVIASASYTTNVRKRTQQTRGATAFLQQADNAAALRTHG